MKRKPQLISILLVVASFLFSNFGIGFLPAMASNHKCKFTPSNFVIDSEELETESVNECEAKTIDLTITNDTYPVGLTVSAYYGEDGYQCNRFVPAPKFTETTYDNFFENEEECEGKSLNKLLFQVVELDVGHITVENVESNLAE